MEIKFLIEQWFAERRVMTREDYEAMRGLCERVREAKEPQAEPPVITPQMEYDRKNKEWEQAQARLRLASLRIYRKRLEAHDRNKMHLEASRRYYANRKRRIAHHKYYLAHKDRWKEYYKRKCERKRGVFQ